MIRILCLFVPFLLPLLSWGQTGTEPRQIEAVDTLTTGEALPSYEGWIMISELDTLGIDDYRYHHNRLALPHLFFKDDSICHLLYVGGDTSCIALHTLTSLGIDGDSLFWINYGGDSLIVVRFGDTVNITYPEPGLGVGGDTTGYWVLQVEGIGNDTIITGEVVNYVTDDSSTLVITQGLTNITWAVPNMRDTCIHTLEKLNDTTAILYDCNGVARGTASFTFNECMEYSMTVSNGIGSDTIFFNKCNGLKDTVVFYPPDLNDSYIDSTRYEYGDSITIWLLRVDTSGVIDSIPLYIAVDSIDTYAYRGVFLDDTLTVYRQLGGVEIDSFKVEILIDSDTDIDSMQIIDDSLHLWEDDIELTVDLTPYLDNDTIYQSLSISTDGLIDTIFLSDDGYVILNDSVIPDTDDQQLSIVSDGLIDTIFLEDGGFVVLNDSIGGQTYSYNGLTNQTIDSIKLGGFLVEDTKIKGQLVTSTTPGSGYQMNWDTLDRYTVSANRRISHITTRHPSVALYNTYGYLIHDNIVGNQLLFRNFDDNFESSVYTGRDFLEIRAGDTSVTNQNIYGQIAITPAYMQIDPNNEVELNLVDSNDILTSIDSNGHITYQSAFDLRLFDYDFIKLQGDTLYAGELIDTLLPRDSTDLLGLIYHRGRVRLGNPNYYPSIYWNGAFYENFVLDQDSIDTGSGLQIYGKRSAIDIYHQTRPYIHVRNALGEFYHRVYDPSGEVGTDPQEYQIGTVGKYFNSTSETYDTTDRAIFVIGDDADARALTIYKNYIQSDIYGSIDRQDTFKVDSLRQLMTTDKFGNFQLVQMDTVLAKLGVVAAAIPEIDTFFLNPNDSIGLDLVGTVGGIQYVDLSGFRTTFSGDTIFSGGDTVVVTDTNFGNTDLTLTGNRMHDLNSNQMQLINADFFRVATPSDQSSFTVQPTFFLMSVNSGTAVISLSEVSGSTFSSIRADDITFDSPNIILADALTVNNSATDLVTRNSGTGELEYRDLSSLPFLAAEVDGSITNEGSLTVAAGTGTTSIINSNTSGSTGVTITAGTNMTITEVGNTITLNMPNSYDNYTSWALHDVGGLVNNIFSGNSVTFEALDGDLTVAGTTTGGTRITFSIPNDAIQTHEISNGTIMPIDLNIGASTAVDEYILTYESTGGTFEWQVNPGLQNLGYTQSTRAMTISSGTGFTFPIMTASLPGLTPAGDGSGTDEFLREDGTWAVPPGTGSGAADELGTNGLANGNIVYMISGSALVDQENEFYYTEGSNTLNVDQIAINGTAASQSITSTGNLGITAASGNMTLSSTNDIIMSATNQVQIGSAHNGLTSITPLASVVGSSNGILATQLENTSSGSSAEMRMVMRANDGDIISIITPSSGHSGSWFGVSGGSGHFITNVSRALGIGTFSSQDLVLGTNNTARMTISGAGAVDIKADAFIGATSTDQLEIQTSSTYAQLGHEVAIDAAFSAYIRFNENLNQLINITNLAGDIRLQSGSNTEIIGPLSVGSSSFPSSAPAYTIFTDGSAGKPGGGSWTDSSDERLKKNINQIDSKNAIDKILALRGVNFEWNDTRPDALSRPEGMQYGMIAQDIVKVFGEDEHFVGKDNDDYYTASYGNYDPLFIESFRYLKNENETMKAQIGVLTEQINKLYELINKK